MPRLAKPISASESVTLGDAISLWTRSLAASDKSPHTLTAYRYAADKLVTHVNPYIALTSVTAETVEALLAELRSSGLSPASLSAVFRPLRTFFRWCVKREYLTKDPMAAVAAPKVVVQPVEFVADAELDRILATTVERSRHAFRARRDRAILVMLATTGARLSEVAGLSLDAVDLGQATITVLGKGGKVRHLPLLPDALEALKLYLRAERPRSTFSSTERLWLGPKGPMTGSGIAQMLADRAKAAGIARRVHPHELRHRFVAKSLKAGMPAPFVMSLSGHTTAAMLNRYGASTRAEDAMDMLRKLAVAG